MTRGQQRHLCDPGPLLDRNSHSEIHRSAGSQAAGNMMGPDVPELDSEFTAQHHHKHGLKGIVLVICSGVGEGTFQ